MMDAQRPDPASIERPQAQGSAEGAWPMVFYDGGCPLCSREIDHYRRLDKRDQIQWVDITRQPALLQRYRLSREQAMQRLHVLDDQRKWHTGSHGFAFVWSRLPGYRWLSFVLSRLGLLRIIEPLYRRFARWRLHRRGASEA